MNLAGLRALRRLGRRVLRGRRADRCSTWPPRTGPPRWALCFLVGALLLLPATPGARPTPIPKEVHHDARPAEQLDALPEEYGNRFLLEPAPDNQLPEHGMRAVDAMRLIGEELVLDGIPMRNLATFVTTWMEPEAQRVIAENLHRNFIDHAEYPQTAEIEQRCIRMLADLFHAPGETTGARTQGSSEAIMLGALSLKWKWRERREARARHRPAQPRLRRRRARGVGEVLPLLRRRAADHPAAARQVHDRPGGRGAPRRREHDRRRRRAGHDVHRPRRRHRRDQRPAGPA